MNIFHLTNCASLRHSVLLNVSQCWWNQWHHRAAGSGRLSWAPGMASNTGGGGSPNVVATSQHTVDRRNHAPVDIDNPLFFIGFSTSRWCMIFSINRISMDSWISTYLTGRRKFVGFSLEQMRFLTSTELVLWNKKPSTQKKNANHHFKHGKRSMLITGPCPPMKHWYITYPSQLSSFNTLTCSHRSLYISKSKKYL